MWNGVDVPMIVSKVTSVEDGGAAPSGDAADTTNAATVLDARSSRRLHRERGE